jgi:hypothetical protein
MGVVAGMGPEVVTPPQFRREVVSRYMRASARRLERDGAGELVWFKKKDGREDNKERTASVD